MEKDTLDTDFAGQLNGSPTSHDEKLGGADRTESIGRRRSAARMAEEAARRQSVAVNIVENPLKVTFFMSSKLINH